MINVIIGLCSLLLLVIIIEIANTGAKYIPSTLKKIYNYLRYGNKYGKQAAKTDKMLRSLNEK